MPAPSVSGASQSQNFETELILAPGPSRQFMAVGTGFEHMAEECCSDVTEQSEGERSQAPFQCPSRCSLRARTHIASQHMELELEDAVDSEDDALEAEIAELRRENARLCMLTERNDLAKDTRAEPGSDFVPIPPRNDALLPLDEDVAKILGAKAISPTIASVLLEIIAIRRNILPTLQKPGLKSSPSQAEMYDIAFDRARLLFAAEFCGDDAHRSWYIEQQFHVLMSLHERWANHEATLACREEYVEMEEEATSSDGRVDVEQSKYNRVDKLRKSDRSLCNAEKKLKTTGNCQTATKNA